MTYNRILKGSKGLPTLFQDPLLVPVLSEGCQYIWCVREPCAVAYSHFKMLQNWFFKPGEVSVEDYIRKMWLTQGEPKRLTDYASYFHHLASWWPHRNDSIALLVFYEELKVLLELCSLYC